MIAMIPTITQCEGLWEKYHLPVQKRLHVQLVSRVANFFAKEVEKKIDQQINIPLLTAAALLHDIDKAIPKRENEHHPDTAVRVLSELDMPKVAALVKTHSLGAILDQNISPKTWEQKLLFLADKMVKFQIIDVDRRFSLWRAENLSASALRQLNDAYPRVKALENEVCVLIGIDSSMVERLA